MIRFNIETNHVQRCSGETLRFTTATLHLYSP
jgi:hypothetical protein